jgi:hypothetical protein
MSYLVVLELKGENMKRIALFFVLLFVLSAYTRVAADHFEEAEAALKQWDFDSAAEGFLSFAQTEPDHEAAPLALYTTARIRMLTQGRPDEGKAIFRMGLLWGHETG